MMKKEQVRCWEINATHGSIIDRLYITYPEGSYGHKLITCLNCGEIFAVNLTKELYVGPSLEEKLKGTICPACNVQLVDYYSEYPEKYLGSDGVVYKYDRDKEIPSDDTSTVREFLEIYSG